MRLIERESQLSELDGLLRDVVAGQGRLALISGEAGAGKSALIRAFAASADRSIRQLVGVCDPIATPRPFGPLFDIAGTTVDVDYSQLNVAGDVNLGGSDLRLTGTYTPALGDVFTIVSATSVVNEFNGLSDGTVVAYKGRVLEIDYTPTTVTLTDVGAIAPGEVKSVAGAKRASRMPTWCT